MSESNQTLVEQDPPRNDRQPQPSGRVPAKLLWSVLGLSALFGFHLYELVRFALHSELYSYVLLVPFVSAYLFSQATKHRAHENSSTQPVTAAILIGLGVAAKGAYWTFTLFAPALAEQDSASLTTFSFVLLLAGVCALFLDRGQFRKAVFPLGFLLFMAPFPIAMEHALEGFLQRGSAPPAYWLLKLVGTPVFRQDMVFELPGIKLQIAPECSGIRSSLVLFMTSLVAGHLFLRSTWSRTLLALFVIPLALVRNGFRVFTIGQLCVSVGPHMIDSAIHHKGGAIFFALSLIPFFLLLVLLIKLERRRPPATS